VARDTRRYTVVHRGRQIALVYISADPSRAGTVNGSVVPLLRRGEWEEDSLELIIEAPVSDSYPDTQEDEQILESLMSLARIEPEKVRIVRLTD